MLGREGCIDYGDYLHWIGSVDTWGEATRVAVAGSYAYVADGGLGLQVIDVSNPALPTIVGFAMTQGGAVGVAVAGSYAYVAVDGGGIGLEVFDVSNVWPTL